MRAFIAIELPEGVLAALHRLQDALPLGRATDPDQLHLTLAFLGERPEADILAAHEALEGLRAPAFEAQLWGLGTFETALWAGVRDAAPLKALQGRVLNGLHGAGLMLERRRFRPHVTLARLPDLHPDGERQLARWIEARAAFPSPPFAVSEVVLWRSTLHRGGAHHDALARYPLEAAPASR